MGFRTTTATTTKRLISVFWQVAQPLSLVGFVTSAAATNNSAFVVPTSHSTSIKSFTVHAPSSPNTSALPATMDDDNNNNSSSPLVDVKYPGTAVQRMNAARERVQQLEREKKLVNTTWDEIRRHILWAGGLKDLPNAIPGQGYTGHSFNDFNHVDLTCMVDHTADNENDGRVQGIAIGNRLGNGIRVASLQELGPGGSWSTCAMGCNKEPPQDVAHLQFQARVAFKLVWVPNEKFDTFVLVDDDGKLLAIGKPADGGLPALRERQMNYQIMKGSKYSLAADKIAMGETKLVDQ